MSRNILGWFRRKRTVNNRKSRQQRKAFGGPRRLRHEFLEDRRMLAAVLTVNVTNDLVDSQSNDPVDDGFLTLRDAIEYVNGFNVGPEDDIQIEGDIGVPGEIDIIKFSIDPDDMLDGKTINLDLANLGDSTQLEITQSVIIDATMLDSGVTIDANDPRQHRPMAMVRVYLR